MVINSKMTDIELPSSTFSQKFDIRYESPHLDGGYTFGNDVPFKSPDLQNSPISIPDGTPFTLSDDFINDVESVSKPIYNNMITLKFFRKIICQVLIVSRIFGNTP